MTFPNEMNSHKDGSEIHLWTAFRQGQRNAFSYLYERFYPKLYSYGINLGMNDSQTLDAIQELFLKLYEKPEIITDATTLQPFLFRSVKNYYINLSKKEARLVNIEEYAYSFSFDYTIEDSLVEEESRIALEKQIREMMSCLTARQREIVYFRFLYEMEYEEIARIMDISQQGARNMLYKAFEKIREKYPQYLPVLVFLLKSYQN